jgi:hypothetical protein
MLALPDAATLAPAEQRMLRGFLGTDLGRALQKSRAAWTIARVRHTALALHLECESGHTSVHAAYDGRTIALLDWRIRVGEMRSPVDFARDKLEEVASRLRAAGAGAEELARELREGARGAPREEQVWRRAVAARSALIARRVARLLERTERALEGTSGEGKPSR